MGREPRWLALQAGDASRSEVLAEATDDEVLGIGRALAAPPDGYTPPFWKADRIAEYRQAHAAFIERLARV